MCTNAVSASRLKNPAPSRLMLPPLSSGEFWLPPWNTYCRNRATDPTSTQRYWRSTISRPLTASRAWKAPCRHYATCRKKPCRSARLLRRMCCGPPRGRCATLLCRFRCSHNTWSSSNGASQCTWYRSISVRVPLNRLSRSPKMKTTISEFPRNCTVASKPQSTPKHAEPTERPGGRREGVGLLAVTGGRAFVPQHHVAWVQGAKRQESIVCVPGGRLPPPPPPVSLQMNPWRQLTKDLLPEPSEHHIIGELARRLGSVSGNFILGPHSLSKDAFTVKLCSHYHAPTQDEVRNAV